MSSKGRKNRPSIIVILHDGIDYTPYTGHYPYLDGLHCGNWVHPNIDVNQRILRSKSVYSYIVEGWKLNNSLSCWYILKVSLAWCTRTVKLPCQQRNRKQRGTKFHVFPRPGRLLFRYVSQKQAKQCHVAYSSSTMESVMHRGVRYTLGMSYLRLRHVFNVR